MSMSNQYKPFNPMDIENSYTPIRVAFRTNKNTNNKSKTKYIPSHTYGEEVSAETYKVYVDTIFREHPSYNIDFEPRKVSGNTMVFHIHKEDIYVDKD